MIGAMADETRNSHLAFKCPKCDTENRQPRTGKTEGGTPVAYCDGCDIEVSAQLIASVRDEQDRARRKAINEFLGWGMDVY